MRTFFLYLVLLFVSPVLSHSSEEKKDVSLEGGLTNEKSVVIAKNETKLLVPDLQVVPTDISVEEVSSDSTVERKQTRKKKRPNNKRRQNRINLLRQKGKKPNGRKRRPQNDKKGYRKNKRPIFKAIHYLARSTNTDQLNKALDDMLECMSLNLANENSTFSVRLNNFREDMKISPWAFLAINKTEITEVERKIRSERATGDSEKEKVESDAAESDEDVDDDETNVEGEAEIEIATESIAEESSTFFEKKEVQATEEENDDDDDDLETVTEISLNFNQPQKTNATQFYRTQKPSPVMRDDGTIEYNLQLLNENDIKHRKLGFTEDYSSDKSQNDRPAKKLEGKRGSSRRNLRRPSAKVEGIDRIKRKGDVLIGVRGNSTTHTIDAALIIGPLQFFMDTKTGFLPQSRVSMASLSARLRMTEVGGKLVGVRLKPTKIRPDETLVTFKLSEDGRIPTNLETARLVTYLSQEMTNVWNSGYLLRRLKRQFKQLFIDGTAGNKRVGLHSKSQDARKLVETLALSAFGASIKDDPK